MTSRTGARIYRRAPSKPLQPGACSCCGRVVALSPYGRRRRHLSNGRPCSGGGVFVTDRMPHIDLDELPDVEMPEPNLPDRLSVGTRRPRVKPDDPRLCDCGWRPRLKRDGTFVAHRTEPDNPAAPYCPNGAPRSY